MEGCKSYLPVFPIVCHYIPVFPSKCHWHGKYAYLPAFCQPCYDCRDVAIILSQLISKSHRVPIPSKMNVKKFLNRCLFLKAKGKTKSNHEVLDLWQSSLRLHDVIDFDVIGHLYPKDQELSFFFVANRYSSISRIKDKSIATCADVTHLLLMFENLRLTLAKKRCEWECYNTIISETCCVFPFVKTSGYHLKVFVFKFNQIYICQTTIGEKHSRRYYVRMSSMSKSKLWQIMVYLQEDKK